MAKMKRMRQKLHTAAAKSKENSKSTDGAIEIMDELAIMPPPAPVNPTAGFLGGHSLFQNVHISSNDLIKQKLPEFDARSSITSKTFKGKNLTKKDKQKIRHEAWQAKIDVIQTAKKKAKDKQRRQNTPVVGDLTPLEDALPTLELLLRKSTASSENRQPKEKPRSVLKEKKRKKQIADDISLFHKVLEHPVFQANAGATIKVHLKNKLLMEAEKEKMEL